MSRTRKIFVGAGLALAMLVGSLVAASPASASATWCLPTSQVKVFGVTVPVGQYCFSVIGSGTRVDFTSGSWNGIVVVNATERVTFFDRNGTSYASWITYRRDGNSYGYRYWRSGISGTARAGGSVCGEFQTGGVVIGRICHRIA